MIQDLDQLLGAEDQRVGVLQEHASQAVEHPQRHEPRAIDVHRIVAVKALDGVDHLRPVRPDSARAVHAMADPVRNGRHRVDIPLDFVNLADGILLVLVHRAEGALVPVATPGDPEKDALGLAGGSYAACFKGDHRFPIVRHALVRSTSVAGCHIPPSRTRSSLKGYGDSLPTPFPPLRTDPASHENEALRPHYKGFAEKIATCGVRRTKLAPMRLRFSSRRSGPRQRFS